MQARGMKNAPAWLEAEMKNLETPKEKKAWFDNLKVRNITKEDDDRKAKQAKKEEKKLNRK